MSKIYSNQTSGVTVVSGKIKSISDDRCVMVITSSEYDRNAKVNNEADINVSSEIPFDEMYRVGYNATAVGYKRGKGTIVAETVCIGNDTCETQDLAIVQGTVRFASLNEEKNADGTPRLNGKGEPKKPHFDITVVVKEDDKYVNHVVKVYAGKEDSKQLDAVQKLFNNYNPEVQKTVVSIVTQPGDRRTSTVTKNGQEYVNNYCYHMGYRSLDILDRIQVKEKEASAPAQTQAAPSQPAPAQPQNTGFTQGAVPIEEDEERYFR